MPLTVRKFNAQVKDPQSGQMVPAGLLSSDSLQAIETAETAAITEIQQKGAQTRESIPDDYTELSDSVDELKTQLDKRWDIYLNASDDVTRMPLTQGTIHNGESLDNPGASNNTAFAAEFISTADSNIRITWNGTIYKLLPVYYDANHVFKAMGGWLTSGSYTVVPTTNNYAYVVVEIRRNDNADFTTGELDEIVVNKVVPINTPYVTVLDINNDISGMLEITKSCIIRGNGHTLDADGVNFGLYIHGGVSVEVYDLHVVNADAEGCYISEGCTGNFYGCSFNNTKTNVNGGNGFQASGVGIDTMCVNCTASGNANDGFNYHGADSHHMLLNCFAENNGGDGASNHDSGSQLSINGGQFNGNTKAGIAAPTYEGKGNIEGVFCKSNKYGMQIYNGEVSAEKVNVINSVFVENTDYALQISGYQVTTGNNVYVGNGAVSQVLHGGTLVDYGSREITS